MTSATDTAEGTNQIHRQLSGEAFCKGNEGREMKVRTVGVAGAGTMGTGIAIVSARAGFRTIVFDENEGAARRAKA